MSLQRMAQGRTMSQLAPTPAGTSYAPRPSPGTSPPRGGRRRSGTCGPRKANHSCGEGTVGSGDVFALPARPHASAWISARLNRVQEHSSPVHGRGTGGREGVQEGGRDGGSTGVQEGAREYRREGAHPSLRREKLAMTTPPSSRNWLVTSRNLEQRACSTMA